MILWITTLSDPIDDLRIHHKNAKMVSIVYDNKGLALAVLDENGRNKKYEYDAFDRFRLERDFENSITRRIDYFQIGNR